MSDITANLVVGMPSQLFTLARSFKANANGKIYLGLPDTDPTIPENQIPVYIESETGDLIPTAQPIVINAGGYPVYNGQISKFVTVQNYSMAVYDAYGSQQFYFPDIAKYDPDKLRQQLESSSGADIVMTGSAPFVVRSVGDILKDIPTNKYFGAKCDGVTDDTVANQTALDWSADNKRTVLFVGKSCTSSRLVLKSGARMENIGSIAPKNFTDTVVIEIKDDAWRSPYNDGITAIQTGNRVLLNNINIDPDEVINAVGIYGTDGVGAVINNARIFNMLNGGVNIEKGYEWKFNNLSVVAPEDQLGTSAISGILHRTSDSMYYNTTVVGYPVGMEITSGANDIVNTHVWGLDGDRSTRVMLIGLKLSGSSNNIINFYSDTPHKLDETQPASLENGGVGYIISGYNNNLIGPRILFHQNDGHEYGKVFLISGTENSIKEPITSDSSGIENNGVYVFTGSATPINNYVSGGNLQSFYVFPQSTGFNPTINAPCTYTSQVYRHELTQRNVSGRLTIVCNITSNVGSGAFSISLPPYLSSFKGDCTGSIFTILNNTIRTDTNLIEVNGYITGGKIFFRRIFRSGSPVDVQITDLITGNATIDLSFTCQL
ncbi:phage head-binding domain-containing protein [Escherichia coli]|uniref:phage head-binding domain-containing protein n=1 Tax=Escherichia coli TaxID=562 RepID=UPI003D231AF6